ncbi:MAG TPA: S9 family peptidase [Methylomirabilota bacterium]|nr:S9 family peptidase [Methylomirabilota bacterium]
MNLRKLTRRQFLFGAAAGAGMVLRADASSFAQASSPRGGNARAAALIPRRLLFGDPDRGWVRISPDGTRIAFLAPFNGVLNLWVAPLADVAKAKPVTRVSDRSLGPSFNWLHDNRHLVFFREQGGDENWQAHRVDLVTGDIRELTPGPGVKSYVQHVSRHFPQALLIAHNQRDKRHYDIYRVDVVTGTSERIETNEQGFVGYVTDPQLRVRYGARYTDDASVEYLQRDPDGDWSLFTRVEMTDAMTTRPIGFSDDGGELYWLDSRGRNTAAVVAQDLKSGTRRVLAEDASADFTDIVLDSRSFRPLAARVTLTRRRWQVIDPEYAADFARLATLSRGDVGGIDQSLDEKHWVVYYERDQGPGQFFHYDRAAKRPRFLFTTRKALEKTPLVEMAPLTLRSRDGLPLVCYLSRPRGAARGTPGPMVLLVHGGPWGRDNWGLSSTHQWLANRGYAVLSVNFRGSTGFGKAFVNAANLEWAGKMHDDLIDGVDWAIAEGVADSKRVAIYGGSYGGYSALVGLTFTPEKFACAVDLVGISNLLTLLETIPPYWKPWQTIWKMRTGDYTTEAGRRFLEERSPLTHVSKIVRPLLIGHGANDPRVKVSESEQIVAAMRERGIAVTYVYYSDEGHAFRRQENRRSFYAVAEAFLSRHLGGRYEPIGEEFKGSTIEFKAGRDLIPGLS